MGSGSGDFVITPWRRFGQERLYVELGDGTKVGWWDPATGQGHPERPELARTLAEAVVVWLRAHPRGFPERLESAGGRQETAEWQDLAATAAGALAREQARALRAEAPVRTFLARALRVHNEERAWRLGAVGEERVGAKLATVARRDHRWRFLHAVPVGAKGSDIDHVAIGPGGVFTINAKHHPRARVWVGGDIFLVNGQRQPYIRNSRHEASRAARLLSAASGLGVHVLGLVVPVRASQVTIKAAPDDVQIVSRVHLARWLLRRPDVLDEPTVDAIYAVARRSTTWRP